MLSCQGSLSENESRPLFSTYSVRCHSALRKVQLIDQYLCMRVTMAAASLPPPSSWAQLQQGAQCLCHLLIAFFPDGRAMVLCIRPKEEKEGHAANLELAGRE